MVQLAIAGQGPKVLINLQEIASGPRPWGSSLRKARPSRRSCRIEGIIQSLAPTRYEGGLKPNVVGACFETLVSPGKFDIQSARAGGRAFQRRDRAGWAGHDVQLYLAFI